MLPPRVVINERRRVGRPSLAEGEIPSADVHLTLPPDDYDSVFALAQQDRTTVQQIIRQAIDRYLKELRNPK